MDALVIASGKGQGSNDVQVPVSALAVDGTNPEQGDHVEFTVAGTVSRIDGDNAYVTPQKINGEEIENPKEEAAETPQDEADEETQMRNLMQKKDQEEPMYH